MEVHSTNYVFAIDGESFSMIRKHNQTLFAKIVHRGRVFARMLPEDKVHLIETLQELG